MSDEKKIPNPNEIKKEFETFIKDKFGKDVEVVTHMDRTEFENARDPQENENSSVQMKRDILGFNLKPKDVKDYLDRFVIQQDEAKKTLGIAVCDHYNHVKKSITDPDNVLKNYSKQNVLLLGPTGVGKTYLVKLIAELIGVPFVKADATRFTESGYVGANVDDVIKDLVNQAGGDKELAQYGIVYIDEGDKLATPPSSIGRDVGGRGVQFGLLKLMEESEVDLAGGNDISSQIQTFMDFQKKGKVTKKTINTKNILFIVSGAFTGLEDIIRKRNRTRSIGLEPSKVDIDETNLLKETTTKDLINFGFEPEFIGRLPIRVSCSHLKSEDLFEILKNSEGSILNQYEQAFDSYGIKISFDDSALEYIAEMASSEKTGARALMTVCERILRQYKFELPSGPLRTLVIDERLVKNPDERLKEILSESIGQKHKDIYAFLNQFKSESGFDIVFSLDAIEYIINQSEKNNKDVQELASALLSGYEHGLKLIEKAIGKKRYHLTKDDLENPLETLDRWIRESVIQ